MAAAKRPSPELSNKINVIPVGNRLQEATAEDYIETAEILNDHADKIDALTGSGTPSPNYGTYTSLALLKAAYPVGETNAYAIIDAGIGATPQLALWDDGLGDWVINSVAENVKFVTNDAARPAPGIENMIYVTLDNFKAYVWKNSQYNLIFSLKSTSDLINDVPFLYASDALSTVSSTNKLITEADLNSSPQPNELIEKGFHHLVDFDWHVFAQKYRWNGVLYEAPEDLVIDTVTIDPAPTTVDFKRFDVVVFNDDFTFSKVKGDEGLNPAIPKIDIRTQLQLTVILVEYGTTEPSYLTKQLMYDEGVGLPAEFAVTKTGANITINDTTQFSSGANCIKVVNPVASNVLFLDKNTTFNSLDIDTISFKIKNGQKSNASFFLYSYNSIGAFYQGTTEIKNGKYGYDSQNITDWQIIIVPRSKILGGSEIHNTGWALTFKPTTGTYYFDEFAMNGNFTQAPITSGIAEAPIDDDYYVRRNAGWFGIGILMTAWNNAVSWITTNGANVLAHLANKQNSLATDGTGEKYPTVDAVNAGLDGKVDDAQVLTNVPAGALFTDTIYNDADVLKDADALTAVSPTNKLITQTDVAGLGGGDMLKSVYDPTNVNGDTFATDLMKNTTVAKVTPIDADNLTLWDSVSSSFKKVTWANIKATLKTYFDTLYTKNFPDLTNKYDDYAWALSDVTTALVAGDTSPVYATFPFTLNGFFVSVGTSPTGASIVVDLKKNGVSVTTDGIAEVASLDITAAPTATGNIVVGLNGVNTNVGVTIGVAEVASLVFAGTVTTAGSVDVSLNGVITSVAVALDDTAIMVADKIRAAAFTGWTTGGTVGTDTVTFTSNTVGIKTDTTYSVGTSAGVTATVTTTTQGVDADTTTTVATKIRGTAFTGWTTSGTGTNVIFTANTVGVKTDATYSAGTTGATGTITTTTQGINKANAVIDATEFTSLTGTSPVVSVSSFAKGDKITPEIVQVGSTIAGADLKIYLDITRT